MGAQVIKEARRASSASGGRPGGGSQTGDGASVAAAGGAPPAARTSASGSVNADVPQPRASDSASIKDAHVEEEVRPASNPRVARSAPSAGLTDHSQAAGAAGEALLRCALG